MLVAPVLILTGLPAIAMLRGLPTQLSRSVLGPILRSRKVRALFSWLTEPIVAWIAFTAATWIWHTRGAFQLALQSEGWHAFEHACFFATALMFWWPVVQPWPSVQRWPRWTMVPYLVLADAQNSVLAALFTFSNHLLYPLYANAPRLGGISPLDDQIVAGAIMWVPGSLFFLVPAAIIMFQILAPRNLTIGNSRIASVGGGSRAADSVAG
jgi:cytochrome c oxidase assembly factor CtaG